MIEEELLDEEQPEYDPHIEAVTQLEELTKERLKLANRKRELEGKLSAYSQGAKLKLQSDSRRRGSTINDWARIIGKFDEERSAIIRELKACEASAASVTPRLKLAQNRVYDTRAKTNQQQDKLDVGKAITEAIENNNQHLEAIVGLLQSIESKLQR